MLGRAVIQPFCGAEEMTAKRNEDGTYCVTIKMIAHHEGTQEPFDVVAKIPRANVTIEALDAKDANQTLYTITIPTDDNPAEIPQYRTTADDWKMLGFSEADARELTDETCS